jgi:hypothetical protein
VPEFLSDAWMQALDAALRSSEAVRTLQPLVVEQLVRNVPGRGDVRYRVWIDGNGGHAAPTEGAQQDAPPDIRFTTDYATAVAIARGTDNAQRALATGRLQLGGRIDVLAQHAANLSALDDVARPLRDTTTYGDGA